MGPPIVPEYCCNASGISTGLIARSVLGVTQVGTLRGQKSLVENVFACQSPGRNMNKPSPCSPYVAEYCCNASGMSRGLIARSVLGVTQVGTLRGQKSLVENVFACQSPGRNMNKPSPCRSFVPDFVTMFSAGPAVQPYSAENAFDRIAIS